MYNIKRSFTKLKREWSDTDVSGMTIADVLANYDDVRIIADFNGTKEIQIRVSSNRNAFLGANQTSTVSAFLSGFLEDTLATIPAFESLANAKCVTTVDLFDLDVTSWKGNASYGEGQTVPPGALRDIAIKSNYGKDTKYAADKLEKNSLFVVNNTVVDSVLIDDVVFLKDGWRRVQLDGVNVFTLIDFTDVGGLEKYRLSDIELTALTRTAVDVTNGVTRVKATVPDYMLGKTPFLVMDGIIHLFNSTYSELSNYDIIITVNHMESIFQQVLRKRDPVEYVNAGTLDEDGFDVDTFDVVKYLKESTSMIAVIGNDDICMMRELMGRTNINHTYNHYRAPKGLTLFGDGTYAPCMVNGWNEHEVELNVINGEYKDFMYKTRNLTNPRVINSSTESGKALVAQDCYAVELYTLNL